jgi:DNA-3-methyladenine glycosylase
MSRGALAAEATSARLGPAFFDRSVHEVAPELIGCGLSVGGCAGVIVET